MTKNLNIIDIATSAMRSVNKAVSTMGGISLNEMPSVNWEPVPEFRVQASKGTFTSIVKFDQKEKKWAKGVIVIFLTSEQIQAFFSKNYGIGPGASDADVLDICGEFCNVVAGGFKKELVNLDYGEIQIDVPINYFKDVNEKIDLSIHNKYQIIFTNDGVEMMRLDVTMESPHK